MSNLNITFKKPVLFLIFNRPDLTENVFEKISTVQPCRLYIAADGPRSAHPLDKTLCNQSRKVINKINWDCKVKTLFREKNLGCKEAVSQAISWFFEHEDEGIILEDDCIPNESFFYFCQEMLDHYRDEKRVMHVSGNNFQKEFKRGGGDYYFSIYNHIWGWATWKRAWKNYTTANLDSKKLTSFINSTIQEKKAKKYWLYILKKIKNNKIDTWDYYWTFSIWQNNGISILPNKNLVKNIGFGKSATHTTNRLKISNQNFEIDFPLKRLNIIEVNKDADLFTEKTELFNRNPMFIRAFNFLKYKIK